MAPNTPPQISLVSPVADEAGGTVQAVEAVGIPFAVQVADAEDLAESLIVRWSAVQTDAVGEGEGDDDDSSGSDDDTVSLGETVPDSTGRSDHLVVGLTVGAWRVTAEVVDTDDATAEVGINLIVSAANLPPSLGSAVLGETPAYESSILRCEPVGWSDPEGSDPRLLVTWNVAGAEVAGASSECDAVATHCELDGTWFDRGDQVFCTLTPDDGALQGEPVTSNTVTIENSAPEPPQLSLTPSPAAQLDQDLVCAVAVAAQDADGDVIADPGGYEVLWYLDSMPAPDYEGLWTIPGVTTELGQEWVCEVRAYDGLAWSEAARVSTTVLPLDGDLVITEFHAAPQVVSDVAGEWVELYNGSASTINLSGFELLDDGSDSHVIDTDVFVAPAARVVLGRNAEFASNGGITVAYEYSGFVLDNDVDEIVLAFDGMEVDRVVYDLSLHGAASAGHSLSLDPSAGVPDAAINDSASNWCLSGTPASSNDGDFGTPGVANGGCACFLSDGDGDGWGDDATCFPADCDDNNDLVNPSAEDICENGVDENCDGQDALCPCMDTDDDGDGYGDGAACTDPDCDDTDPDSNPAATEVCDGEDNDCDGSLPADEADADGDGDRICEGDCDDTDPLLNLSDFDGDLYSSCDDCDDGEPSINPAATEACDGVDTDCDGSVDEAGALNCQNYFEDVDDDNYGDSAVPVQCLCSEQGDFTATQGGDCYDDNANAYPGAPDTNWYTADRGDGSYDYDCDNTITLRWTAMSDGCAFFTDICDGNEGWEGSSAPGCGETRDWESGCHYEVHWPLTDSGCYWNDTGRTQGCH